MHNIAMVVRNHAQNHTPKRTAPKKKTETKMLAQELQI